MVVSRSPCATLGGDSPDLQVGVAATSVGGLLEPQLKREATNAAVSEAAAAETRRRARADSRKQTVLGQPGLAHRSCQRAGKCGPVTGTRSRDYRYTRVDADG